MKAATSKISLLPILPFILLIIIWELAVIGSNEKRFLFGTPSELLPELLHLMQSSQTWVDIYWTGSACLAGLVIGTAVGTLIGFMLSLSKTLEKSSGLALSLLGSLPVLALAPIFILWCGIGWAAKVWLATLGSALIAERLAFSGAKSALNTYSSSLYLPKASRFHLARLVILPGSLTMVLEGIKPNANTALLGVIIGEFINSEAGLGHALIRASSLYRANEVWSLVIILGALALFLGWGVERVGRCFTAEGSR